MTNDVRTIRSLLRLFLFMAVNYRFYYDKSFDYLLNEELKYLHFYSANISAKQRLRMYANLFTRDLRKVVLTQDSECNKCKYKSNLQIDHVHPISKGGLNVIDNIQILCMKCNRLKSNKI